MKAACWSHFQKGIRVFSKRLVSFAPFVGWRWQSLCSPQIKRCYRLGINLFKRLQIASWNIILLLVLGHLNLCCSIALQRSKNSTCSSPTCLVNQKPRTSGEFKRIRNERQEDCWWDAHIENLGVEELDKLKVAMLEMKENCERQAEKLMSERWLTLQQYC